MFGILFEVPLIHATTYYWDTNNAAGFGNVKGTWDTSAFWNTSSSGATNGTFVSNPTSSDNLYISGGRTGTITLVGTKYAGSMTFTNNVDVTLSGGTLALGGTTTNKGLFVDASNQSKTSILSAITLNTAPITLQTAGTNVLLLYGGITGAQNLVLKNNSTHASGISISSGSVNNAGSITNSGTGSGGVIISSVIGTNVTGITQNSDTSMLTLSGSNTYNGATTISAGTLTMGANEVIPDISDVTVNGRLRTGGYNETIGSLSGSGTIDNNNGGANKHSRLIVGSNHASTNFSGTISSSGGNRMEINKVGTGTLTLSGSDTADDTLTINAGVVRINATAALTGGNLTLNGGVLGLGVGNFARSLGSGNGQVQFTGNGGFAAYTADRSVNLGCASANLIWNSTHDFLTAEQILIFGASSADKTLTFQNPIDLHGATRTVQVDNGSAIVDAILSGVLSGTTSGLTKTGTGTLTISNTNTYTGATLVNEGTLNVSGSLAAGTAVTVSVQGTLKGIGFIHDTINNHGILAPGFGIGVLSTTGMTMFDHGSIFEWEIDTTKSNRGTAYDGMNTKTVSGRDAIFKIVLTGTQNFSDTFWDSNHTWTDIFKRF